MRSVSALPSGGAESGQTYQVVVAISDLPEDAASAFRLGLAARMEIIIYSKPDALLVPLEAIMTGRDGDRWVFVKPPGGGEAVRREIAVGETSLAGVEISSGVEAGDTVLLPAR